MIMMIAFLTFNSSLVHLIEGLSSSNPAVGNEELDKDNKCMRK